MLFTYQYINHEVEKLQEYLDFLFYEVWMLAEYNEDFDKDKLGGNLELQDIYIKFDSVDYDPNNPAKNKRGKWADFFNKSIEKIFREFAKIDDDNFKLQLIDFYANNNNIEELCTSKSCIPISFADIEAEHPDLAKALTDFYSKLYGSNSPFNLEAFGQLNKKLLPTHYEAFMNVNDEGICPFCGISDIKSNNSSSRDAYDHYLPKSKYPFNSLNFKNLAPMCHTCNSDYKHSQDPIYRKYSKQERPNKENKRELSFYPFAKNHPNLEINLDIKSNDIKSLKPADITLSIDASSCNEQIHSWKRVFGIEERYKEILCAKHKAKEWFVDIYDDFENAQTLEDIDKAEAYYQKVLRATNRNNKSAENILRRKFLEDCKSKGLFDNKAFTQSQTK